MRYKRYESAGKRRDRKCSRELEARSALHSGSHTKDKVEGEDAGAESEGGVESAGAARGNKLKSPVVCRRLASPKLCFLCTSWLTISNKNKESIYWNVKSILWIPKETSLR